MKRSRTAIYLGAIFASFLGGASGWTADTRSAAELAHNDGVRDLSVEELEHRVAGGDLSAQAELGARYGRGEGVPQNLSKALELIRGAAEKNSPDGAYYLGLIYTTGTGVPKNEAQAVLFFDTAADQGHPAAQYMLGSMISQGKGGIDVNLPSALSYFWHAADSGYPPAEFALGHAYQMGLGTPRNPKAAAYWYRRTDSRMRHRGAEENLQHLIESGEVEWQQGDPAPRPKLDATISTK